MKHDEPCERNLIKPPMPTHTRGEGETVKRGICWDRSLRYSRAISRLYAIVRFACKTFVSVEWIGDSEKVRR